MVLGGADGRGKEESLLCWLSARGERSLSNILSKRIKRPATCGRSWKEDSKLLGKPKEPLSYGENWTPLISKILGEPNREETEYRCRGAGET